MFKKIDTNCLSNKDKQFLEESDLVVGWGKEGDISFYEVDEKLPLLFSRLAYVFDIVDKKIKEREDFDYFVDVMNGLRIKKTLQEKKLTLPDVADILSRIDEAEKVSFLIKEDDEAVLRAIIAFGGLIGLDKVGLFIENFDGDELQFYLVEE